MSEFYTVLFFIICYKCQMMCFSMHYVTLFYKITPFTLSGLFGVYKLTYVSIMYTSHLFFVLIILLYFFSLLFSIMPNFNANIFVWSWLVSFPHLLHSSFSYLKYLTDFDEAVATLNIKISFQRCRLISVQFLDVLAYWLFYFAFT